MKDCLVSKMIDCLKLNKYINAMFGTIYKLKHIFCYSFQNNLIPNNLPLWYMITHATIVYIFYENKRGQGLYVLKSSSDKLQPLWGSAHTRLAAASTVVDLLLATSWSSCCWVTYWLSKAHTDNFSLLC